MTRFTIVKAFLALTVFWQLCAFAQTEENAQFQAQEPVLITSAGQSADALMIKVLSEKAGLEYQFDKIAPPEKVDSAKSVIIVCGGSTKGLGAANIDKEQEYQRVETLIQRAKKNKLPIITTHVGGKSRRGTLSDYFNQLAAENADYLIVVSGGDEDGFFSGIAKEKEITIELPEKIAFIQEILEKIYAKNTEQEE
jgi:hypothetical protein